MAAGPKHERDLSETIRRSPWLIDLLCFLETQAPTQTSVGAGAIAAQVWNAHHGFDGKHGIKDIDVVYFDPHDLSKTAEEELERRLEDSFATLRLPFDVKNQARVHIWYREKFGYEIPAYPNLEAAVATWPTTATAVAISFAKNELNIVAPLGLEDLLNCIVRPNKRQITEEIYERKVARWRQVWPDLHYLAWDWEKTAQA